MRSPRRNRDDASMPTFDTSMCDDLELELGPRAKTEVRIALGYRDPAQVRRHE